MKGLGQGGGPGEQVRNRYEGERARTHTRESERARERERLLETILNNRGSRVSLACKGSAWREYALWLKCRLRGSLYSIIEYEGGPFIVS